MREEAGFLRSFWLSREPRRRRMSVDAGLFLFLFFFSPRWQVVVSGRRYGEWRGRETAQRQADCLSAKSAKSTKSTSRPLLLLAAGRLP